MTGEYNSVVLSMFYMRSKKSVLDRYHIKEHLVNIKRCSYVVFMLGHRLRRCPNIKTTQLHQLVLTGCFIGVRGVIIVHGCTLGPQWSFCSVM